MSARKTPGGLPKNHAIAPLPSNLTSTVTKLSSKDHRTLIKKRKWFETYNITGPPSLRRRGEALDVIVNATLVFAQEEAGTAICVSPRGFLLTCSHCVAETEEELRWDKIHWLLFSSGQAVAAETVIWDPKRDLALLMIVRASFPAPSSSPSSSSFPYLRLAHDSPKLRTALLCIGHPGSEDLETSTPGVQTNYDVLVLSTGKFHGLDPDQDAQDNSEIGALMHDCWTYWGHSGAPLVEQKSGLLVGVHSSWDDETGMRRGVGWEAVKAFLEESGRLLRLSILGNEEESVDDAGDTTGGDPPGTRSTRSKQWNRAASFAV
ncbi:trypsin-like peptidase domain-containing protein [Sarocladium implicatum]|nr:trypsin-like peptidase domain-containing protein [Sarocladium implicatum]